MMTLWNSVCTYMTASPPPLFYDEKCTVPEAAHWHYDKQGEVAWVRWEGKDMIITSKPSLARHVFRESSFHSRFGTDEGLKRLGMYECGVIWNNDRQTWNSARKHGFLAHLGNESLKKGADVAVHAMLQKLEKALEKGGPFDMLKAVRLATMEVPLRVFLGITKELSDDFLEGLVDAVVAYFEAWEYFLCRPRSPREGCKHDKQVSDLRAKVQELLDMVAEQNDLSESTEFVAEAMRSPDPVQLVLELLLATTDTSSVSLFYLLVHLAGDQDLQEKLYACDDHDEELAVKCLNEAMRFKPVGPVVLRQATDDTSCDGVEFSAGSCVVVDLSRIHRRSDIFPHPDRFDPSNFDERPSFFFPFGDGGKGCVGQHLAMKEMIALLRAILSAVRITHPVGQRVQCLEDVETRWDIANQPVDSIMFMLEAR
eukprot:TRINITY_DN504_c0_g3_i1.p1 TRINITY_DN504_c0_g3~~TRINITY_DN504_c0_g3_i1.p1  ORF type:complete len:446 (+),score=117.94 TRINITY_DN504_c0_g3_i1:63-1340(+)